MTEEMVKYEAEQGVKIFQPVMSIDEMADRYQMMARVTSDIMREGQDYGIIPGTGKKPTLLKPGAEKLATFFGLRKEFSITKEEDWTGEHHGGEPFFYYLVRCSLYRSDVLMAAADGSCNSWESKYRYRKDERECPACGAAAIIKGKQEYGGGWVCFKKKGGCGAKFQDGDASIDDQSVGRVPNKDIFDQVNTILKMAEKRALVAGVLLAVGASEFFTQDMEDIIDADWVERAPQPKPQPRVEPEPEPNGRPWDAATLRANLLKRTGQLRTKGDEYQVPPAKGVVGMMTGQLNGMLGDDDRRHTFLQAVFGSPSTKDMDKAQVQSVLDWMDGKAGMEVITDEANRLVNGVMVRGAVGALLPEAEVDDES